MAEQLIANLAEPFDPAKYTDDYRANLMRVIKAKMKGQKIEAAEPEEEQGDTQVLDLMSRLQASLAGGKRDAGRGERKSAASKPRKPARSGRTKTA